MLACNGPDRGCNITPCESRQTSLRSRATEMPENLHYDGKQMYVDLYPCVRHQDHCDQAGCGSTVEVRTISLLGALVCFCEA